MMMGKADGLRLLDLSADGFWNSFFAIVIALPALVVGWVGVANELSQLSAEFGGKFSIVARLAAIDLATWILPLVVLAAAASRAGIADRFVATTSWRATGRRRCSSGSCCRRRCIRLFWPTAGDASSIVALVLFMLTMVLSWRMTNVAIGKGPAVATAVFAGMFLVSLAVFFVLQAAFGLAAPAQAPAG